MEVITITCPECGTVVAGNELESRRVMKCPGLECGAVHRFDDLSERDRERIVESRSAYDV